LFPLCASVKNQELVLLMHPLFRKADELSHTAIGAAIEVHRLKGPGLLESIYEKCMMREFSLRNLAAVNQRLVEVEYKGVVFEELLRFDVFGIFYSNCCATWKCFRRLGPR
jgi:GxxExxY protein